LNHIWRKPGVSRKDISADLGLHPNLVSDAVLQLIREEWIVEGGRQKVAAGRAPIALYLDPQQKAGIAVSYDSERLTCGLVNANGEIIQKVEMDHAADLPEDLVEKISRVLIKMKQDYGGHVIGVGVADPGMVDSTAGEVVRSSFFPKWNHVPMAKLVEQETGLMVFVEDCTRVRAGAQYRITLELHQKHATMLYVEYGEGIGFVLVTQEGIWRGARFAGEVGHVVMEPQGALCRCGASGCLESMASPSALETKAGDLLAQGVNSSLRGSTKVNAEAIFRAALEGDRMARSVVKAIVDRLGLATAFLVAALHPPFVVVGAETETAIRCLCKELRSALESRTLTEIASTVEIIEGMEFRPLALIGAGLMVFERTFNDKRHIS